MAIPSPHDDREPSSKAMMIDPCVEYQGGKTLSHIPVKSGRSSPSSAETYMLPIPSSACRTTRYSDPSPSARGCSCYPSPIVIAKSRSVWTARTCWDSGRLVSRFVGLGTMMRYIAGGSEVPWLSLEQKNHSETRILLTAKSAKSQRSPWWLGIGRTGRSVLGVQSVLSGHGVQSVSIVLMQCRSAAITNSSARGSTPEHTAEAQ